MVVDFKDIIYDDPVLILKRIDGVPIGTISGYCSNIKCSLNYNELSVLEFELSAVCPCYDDVVGMMMVELVGVGQFSLVNPKVTSNGIKETKQVKGYSLEIEFGRKTLAIINSTYQLYSPFDDNCIVDIILEKMPNWSLESCDYSLIGKFRTLELTTQTNLYDFIKNTVQQKYGCIFDFDTFNRKIRIIDVESQKATKSIYLSQDNLIKEIEIDEDTESIITALDVNGAEGVDIRNVNPMGINKIFRLDYLLGVSPVSDLFQDKYELWKNNFESVQESYFNLVVARNLKISQKVVEESNLAQLQAELNQLEVILSVRIEGGLPTGDINIQIASKQTEITNKTALIESIQGEIDSYTSQLIAINNNAQFSNYFNEAELNILDLYLKEGSISESSFVVPTVNVYTADVTNDDVSNVSLSVSNAMVTQINSVPNKVIYSVQGGTISVNNITSNIVRLSAERKTSDGSCIISAYLSNGTYGEDGFATATIILNGSCGAVTSNTTSLSLSFSGTLIYTRQASEYQQYSVSLDLYEYGIKALEKLSVPSYTFSVDSGNFIASDDFTHFKNQLELGSKVYVSIQENKVLQPYVIGVEFSYDDLSSFNIVFSDKYASDSAEFRLVDLLEQSISMGKNLDASKYSYNAYRNEGANTALSNIINNALDVAKNQILSASGIAPVINDSGLHMRKQNPDGSYDPKQMRIINNQICLTSDSWDSINTVIGELTIDGVKQYGIITDVLIGKIVATNNLVIESSTESGDIKHFKMDGNGLKLWNSPFNLSNGVTEITINPYSGFAIGGVGLYNPTTYEIDTDKAKFWIDTSGNVHIKGILEAASGTFSGTVQAQRFLDAQGNDMMSDGKFNSDYLDLGNIVVDGETGNITMAGSITLGGSINLSNASNITWGNNAPIKSQFSANGSSWHDTFQTGDKYRRDWNYSSEDWGTSYQFVGTDGAPGSDANVPSYIKSTYIDGTSLSSPSIRGGIISGALFTNLTGTIENPSYSHWLQLGADQGRWGFIFGKGTTFPSNIFSVYDGDAGYHSLCGKSNTHIWVHNADTNTLDIKSNVIFSGTTSGVVAVFG